MRFDVMNVLEENVDKKVTLYNPLDIDWNSFDWSDGFYKHKITKDEIMRPYMLSYSYYGDVVYTQEILLLNNIDDPFNVAIGKEIFIPKLNSLKTFLLKNRK